VTLILAFSAEQVSKLSGLSTRQLRYWDETDFFHPNFLDKPGKPYGRVYSFRDVVSLRVLALLRNKYQVSLQELRKVGQWLAQQSDDDWAASRFYVAGRHVYFYGPRTQALHEGRRPQQSVIPVELQEVVADTERRAQEMQKRTEDEIGHISQHRYISHNAPVLSGTRIRTSAIWSFHRAGYSTNEILKEYPRLTQADIEAAIDFESRQRQAAS
jgi:uncharacterized protein (DUF433 family)